MHCRQASHSCLHLNNEQCLPTACLADQEYQACPMFKNNADITIVKHQVVHLFKTTNRQLTFVGLAELAELGVLGLSFLVGLLDSLQGELPAGDTDSSSSTISTCIIVCDA